jgi:hypothetical protein
MKRNEKGQFAPKCGTSVIDAVLQVYDQMDTTFHGVILIERVRVIIGRFLCYDGSILRDLRRLREDGKINYRVKNTELSIYEKL